MGKPILFLFYEFFIFSDLMFSPLLSYLRNHRSDFLSFHLLIYLLFQELVSLLLNLPLRLSCAKMECNLLGLTVDEALSEVDSFIDRAILNGQTVVYLIHGNGTGALRTAIHKHLRGNRMVKSFRLGRYGEGESGVTVVELK